MRPGRALREVVEAAEVLSDEATVVRLAAEAVGAACPRGTSAAYTFRGLPSYALGPMTGWRDGRPFRCDDFAPLWRRSTIAFDRSGVEPGQRNTWMDPIRALPAATRARYLESPVYREFFAARRLEAQARMLVTAGPRPLALVGVALDRGAPYFSKEEMRRLGEAAGEVAGALRIAATLGHAEPALQGVDALLASRTDAAAVLSRDGDVVAASARAARLLDSTPELWAALGAAVRGARRGIARVTVRGGALEVLVSRCSALNSAAAFLAIIDAVAKQPARLSPRQATLIDHLAEGLSNAEIADRMEIAPATVKTMLERLYREHRVSGRVALLSRVAARRG